MKMLDFRGNPIGSEDLECYIKLDNPMEFEEAREALNTASIKHASFHTLNDLVAADIAEAAIISYLQNSINDADIYGGLDVNNRLQFIGLLNKQMEILKCQQAIMISHNSEASLENVW